jgi:D-sedoheptulose 7-phosphate isomerase
MDIINFAKDYLNDLAIIKDKIDLDAFTKITDVLLRAHKERRQIFVLGNGGSASTASHLACDLNKCACENTEKKFKVISLCDNIPTMLAIANDIDYESVFSYQLENFFEKGDIVLGISGSGNSENVIKAVEYCNANEGLSIGISGFDGGKLAKTANIPLVIPSHDMQKVEDYHMILCHILMRSLKGNIE